MIVLNYILVYLKKMGGVPQVHRLVRIGKLEQQFLFAIKDSNNINLEAITKLFNMHFSSAKRVIYALERKKKIRIENNIIYLREETVNDFNTYESIFSYYDYLRKTQNFKNKTNGIELTTDFLYFHLFDEEINRNESMMYLKERNLMRFKQLINGLTEHLIYIIENTQRKIRSWSESKYEFEIDNVKASLILTRTHKPAVFKNTFDNSTIEDMRILCECIFMMNKGFQELLEKVKSIIHLDYTNV